MAGDGMEVVLIELSRIKPNAYNPNVVSDDILAKLRAEIAQHGLAQPIIVRREGNDGYLIVDGEHRWRVCRDLGMREIPCIIQDFSDTEAKIKTVQLNYLHGAAVPVKLASLIHDLSKEIKLEDLARRLPYEEVQLQDSLELLKLPEDFGKTIEEQAKIEAEGLPSVITFVLYKQPMVTLEQALVIAAEGLPEGAKNRKALALEQICLDYLARQEDKEESEAGGESQEQA